LNDGKQFKGFRSAFGNLAALVTKQLYLEDVIPGMDSCHFEYVLVRAFGRRRASQRLRADRRVEKGSVPLTGMHCGGIGKNTEQNRRARPSLPTPLDLRANTLEVGKRKRRLN
jgi:hypothetical protein